MSYAAPTITSAGLFISTYLDLQEDLIDYFKTIYGQDCYLEEDSADYQWLSIVSLRHYDCLSSLQLCYNNRGPQTAIGSGLDQIVKLNGLERKSSTYSTCLVKLTGIAGTIIYDGEVVDTSGYRWSLPSSTEIDDDGTVEVTATCQTVGAIVALENAISIIGTPTAGWLSVTNEVAATIGLPVETDAALRARQALSTTRPSMNLLTGTISAIAAMEDVTRSRVVENYTNEYDIHGNPPHSITCVVEGGTDEDIAETIWLNRGIGCYTNGDVEVPVTDPITGIVTNIRFYRPIYVSIYVTVTLTPLYDYSSAVTEAIRQAIVDYLNALQIGSDVTISALYAAAMAVTEDIHDPKFSILEITAASIASPQETIDITLLFNQVARGILGNVDIVVY